MEPPRPSWPIQAGPLLVQPASESKDFRQRSLNFHEHRRQSKLRDYPFRF